MENEIWKDIPGYDSKYKISNYGNVYSEYSKKNLRLGTDKGGHRTITLRTREGKKKIYQVHRLVAQAFILNPENKPFVLHKVGVNVGGTDHVSNLYWGDHMENMKDRKKEGYHSKQAEEKLGRPVLQIDLKTKEIIMEHPSTESAARHLNKTSQNISAVCRGERLSAYGYFWKYKYPKTN